VPIYEYRCGHCGRKVSIWWRSAAQVERSQPECPRCHGRELQRLVSKTAFVRSGESRLDSFADGELGGLDEQDPRSLGRLMRQLGEETGEDMGEEFDEIVGRLEAGESPEDIEQSLPGAFGEDDSMLDGDAFDPDLM